jgi:hypothetical protein
MKPNHLNLPNSVNSPNSAAQNKKKDFTMISVSSIYKPRLPKINLPYTGSNVKELNSRAKAQLHAKSKQLQNQLPTPQNTYNTTRKIYSQSLI